MMSKGMVVCLLQRLRICKVIGTRVNTNPAQPAVSLNPTPVKASSLAPSFSQYGLRPRTSPLAKQTLSRYFPLSTCLVFKITPI